VWGGCGGFGLWFFVCFRGVFVVGLVGWGGVRGVLLVGGGVFFLGGGWLVLWGARGVGLGVGFEGVLLLGCGGLCCGVQTGTFFCFFWCVMEGGDHFDPPDSEANFTLSPAPPQRSQKLRQKSSLGRGERSAGPSGIHWIPSKTTAVLKDRV